MEKTRYIFTKTISIPYVVSTPLPHKPVAVRRKTFKEGETVMGKLQYKLGKPVYILVGGALIIPLYAVRELVTKEVDTSSADGSGSKSAKVGEKFEKFSKGGNPKIKYLDAALVGALAGAALGFLAEKKGWLVQGTAIPDKNIKLYCAGGAAVLAMYLVYRVRNRQQR